MKPDRCRMCSKDALPGRSFCGDKCGQRWRCGRRQRLYWCTKALIESGALAWDGQTLVVVARVVLDESHTLRVVDSLNGRAIPTRATRSDVPKKTPPR